MFKICYFYITICLYISLLPRSQSIQEITEQIQCLVGDYQEYPDLYDDNEANETYDPTDDFTIKAEYSSSLFAETENITEKYETESPITATDLDLERERLNCLCDDIIADIKSRNYTDADEKIMKLGVNSTRIKAIVFEMVFQSNVNYFAFIKDYAMHTSKPMITLHLMGAYWSLVLSWNRHNVSELCDLYKTLEDKVVNSNSKLINESYVEYTRQHLKAPMGPFIADIAAKELSANLANGASGTSDQKEKICEISEKIFSLNPSIFDDTVKCLNVSQICDFYHVLANSNQFTTQTGLSMEKLISEQIKSRSVEQIKMASVNGLSENVEAIASKINSLSKPMFSEILEQFDINEKIDFYNALTTPNEMKHLLGLMIEKEGGEKTNDALKGKTFDHFTGLADKIHAANESLFDKIVCTAIDDMYSANNVNFDYLKHIMSTHRTTSQKASVLLCFFQKLYPNINTNGQNALFIAHYFDKLRNLDDFYQLSKNKLNDVQDSFDKLPPGIQALYSYDLVCFRNSFTQNYMGVKNENVEKDDIKGHVVKGQKRKLDFKAAAWTPKALDEYHFEFQSFTYSKEYLYPIKSWTPRFFWLWYHVGSVEKQKEISGFVWRLSFANGKFTLGNTKYNGNLAAHPGKYDEDVVITSGITTAERYDWILESCDDKISK